MTARTRVVAALATLLSLVAGCAGSPHATSDDVTEGARLADVDVLDDPRAYEGPSTAHLSSTAIEPIADDPVPDLPAVVTDVQGTEVVVEDVSRILALDLYGTTARTVFELGLGENVVGRDVSSGFAEIQDRQLVTSNGHDLNGEAILDLAPTVIITDTSLGPWDVVLQMRDAGIPVVIVDSHRSMDNAADLIRQIGAALGVPEEAERLAERTSQDIDATVEAIEAVAPAEDERLRMVFLYVRGQSGIYYMFGPGSGVESLVAGLAGVDVATEIGWSGMQPVTDEGLVAAQPDVILMMSDGLESVGGVDGLLERLPAIALTPAGERQRIVDMADHEILSFGPNTADVLDALAVAVYAPDEAP